MVKPDLVVPANLVMTTLALLTQCLLMGVVTLVATGTTGPTQLCLHTVHMAAFTANILVGTL